MSKNKENYIRECFVRLNWMKKVFMERISFSVQRALLTEIFLFLQAIKDP